MNSSSAIDKDKLEQIERGKRIKYIRENELHMSKTKLAKEIGVSGQFLGLVEDGKGNLVYKSIKKLRDLSGPSADYILFGMDDKTLEKTKLCINKFSENDIKNALDLIENITLFIKDV